MAFLSDKSAIEAELLKLVKVFPALTPVRAKKPYRSNWQQESALSLYALTLELHSGRATGVGLRSGKISGGILCLDFDGHSALAKYLELSGGVKPPETVRWTSGKPGRFQLAFRVPEDEWDAIATKKIPTAWDENGKADEFLEIRWDGCQSVLPPSIHPETGGYIWERSLSESEIAECPSFILKISQAEPKPEYRETRDLGASANPWDIRNFQEYLEGGGKRRRGWNTWKCPAHNGTSSDSLHINEATGQFKCHASCDPKDVYRAALDLAKSCGYQVPERRSGHTCGGFVNPINRVKELLAKASRSNWGWRKKDKDKPLLTPASIPDEVVEYQEGEFQDTLISLINSGTKHILVADSTGTGKSYKAGQLQPKLLGAEQIVYISNEHRNPTTPTLAALPDLEGRHNGLYRDDAGRIRRVTKGQAWISSPNCESPNTIAALRAKNVRGADTSELICSRCPYFIDCISGDGNYDYLHQRSETLDEPYFRSAPSSLPNLDGENAYDYSDVALIWDDTKLQIHKSFDVAATDLEKTIAHLAINHPSIFDTLRPLLSCLLPYLNGEKKAENPWGWKLAEIKQALPEVSIDLDAVRKALAPNLALLNPLAEYGEDAADFATSEKARFAESDAVTAERVARDLLLNWLPDFFEILKGGTGYLQINQKKLTITVLDDRLRRIAAASKVNIFLDATLDQSELAATLGIAPGEIVTIKQATPEIKNLEVIQVAMGRRLGIGSRRKTKDGDDTFLGKRISAVVNQIRVEHPNAKISTIDFKKNGADGAWWVDSRGFNHFQATDILVLIGTPTPNLSALSAEFTVLYGRAPIEGTEAIKYPIFTSRELPEGIEAYYEMNVSSDPEFRDFVRRRVLAEIEQAIGRLRANRRPHENLKLYFIGDYPLEREVNLTKASSITPDAMDKQEIFITAVKGAIAQLKAEGKKVTQSAIAAIAGYSQQYLSKLKNLLLMLLESDIAKVVKNSAPTPERDEAEWASDIYLPLLAKEHSIEGILGASDIYGERFKEIFEATAVDTQLKILQALLSVLPHWELGQIQVAFKGW